MCAAKLALKFATESAQEARAKAGIYIVKVSTKPFGPFKYDDTLTDNSVEINDVIVCYADIIISYQNRDADDDLIDSQDLYIELKTKKGPKYVFISDDEYFDALSKIKGQLFVQHKNSLESLIGFSNALKHCAKEIKGDELRKYDNNIRRFNEYLRWGSLNLNRNLVMIITSNDPRFKPRYITANTAIKHAKYLATLDHLNNPIDEDATRLSSDDEE